MSADDVDAANDVSTLVDIDVDSFIEEFESWYRDEGNSMNPYDATDIFIDYYANRKLYLPFARRKLLVEFVINATYLIILLEIFTSFMFVVIGQVTNNVPLILFAVIGSMIVIIIHSIARLALYHLRNHESDISIDILNYKSALYDVMCPAGKLADFITTITKYKPTPKDEMPIETSDSVESRPEQSRE